MVREITNSLNHCLQILDKMYGNFHLIKLSNLMQFKNDLLTEKQKVIEMISFLNSYDYILPLMDDGH